MIGYLGRKFAAKRRGQGMTEYIIIVALVAIALITIVSLFGNKIKFLFTGSVKSLDEGKVTNPNSVQSEATLKNKLGDDQVKLDNQKKGHTLKSFKSGD
ncbi:MAG: pilus assembly protein [Planctomycetota bacterium]